jgi:hypothetical protein
MPPDSKDDTVQTVATVRNPLSTPELGHVALAPTEIVPVLGLSPIEALQRKIHRALPAADHDASATNEGETRAKRPDEK